MKTMVLHYGAGGYRILSAPKTNQKGPVSFEGVQVKRPSDHMGVYVCVCLFLWGTKPSGPPLWAFTEQCEGLPG